jgi:hypothetical protein
MPNYESYVSKKRGKIIKVLELPFVLYTKKSLSCLISNALIPAVIGIDIGCVMTAKEIANGGLNYEP